MKKIFKVLAFVIVAALAFSFVACAKTTLSLDKTEVSVKIGATATITPAVENGKAEEIAWSSSDESVATVSAGTITAVKVGTATITATLKKLTATVTVTVFDSTLSLDKTAASVEVGKTVTLTATKTNTEDAVVWATSDASVATVEDGKVTGVEAGTATITATVDGKSATCTVTVARPKVASIAIDCEVEKFIAGQTAQLKATVLPTYAIQTLTWESDDEETATVDENGLVTMLKPGSCIITATSTANSAISCDFEMEIDAPDPENINVTAESTQIEIEQTLQLSAAVLPALANQSVVWSSADETIATVDEAGLVTALAAGQVEITATSKFFSSVKGSITITIVLPTATELSVTLLDPTASTIAIGETSQIVAGILPALADQSVEYKSSDDAIATVDEAGLITAIKAGTATITVTSKTVATLSQTLEITVIEKPSRPEHADVLLSPEAAKAAKYSSITYNEETFINGLNYFSSLEDAVAALVDGSTLYVEAGYYAPAEKLNITVSNVDIIGTEADSVYTKDYAIEFTAEDETYTRSILKGAQFKFGEGVENITFQDLVFTGSTHFESDLAGNKNITFDHNTFQAITSASGSEYSMDGMLLFYALNGSYSEDIWFINNVITGSFSNPRFARFYNINNLYINNNIWTDSFSGYFYDYFRMGAYDTDMAAIYPTKVEAGTAVWGNNAEGVATEPNTASGDIYICNNIFHFCNQSVIYGSCFRDAVVEVQNNYFYQIPAVLWNRGILSDTTMNFVGNAFIDCSSSSWDIVGTWGNDELKLNVNYNYWNKLPEDGADCVWVKNNKWSTGGVCETAVDTSNNFAAEGVDVTTEGISSIISASDCAFFGKFQALTLAGVDTTNAYDSIDAAVAAGKKHILLNGAIEADTTVTSAADVDIVGIACSLYNKLTLASCTNVTVNNVLVEGSKAQIYTDGGSNVTVKNIVVDNATVDGPIYFAGDTDGFTVKNVKVEGKAGSRIIYCAQVKGDVTIDHMVMDGASTAVCDAIRIGMVNTNTFNGNLTMTNCVIKNTYQSGIMIRALGSGSTLTVKHNYFESAVAAVYTRGTPTNIAYDLSYNTFVKCGSVASDWDVTAISNNTDGSCTVKCNYNAFYESDILDRTKNKDYAIKVRLNAGSIDCSNNYFSVAEEGTDTYNLNAIGLSLCEESQAGWKAVEATETQEQPV